MSWGGAVDLVGQHHVREHGPLHELESALPGGAILLQNFCASDVGRHEVGCELDPLKLEIQYSGQSGNEQSLRQTRYAFKQTVPAGEQGDEEFIYYMLLSDNDFGNLRANLIPLLPHRL